MYKDENRECAEHSGADKNEGVRDESDFEVYEGEAQRRYPN